MGTDQNAPRCKGEAGPARTINAECIERRPVGSGPEPQNQLTNEEALSCSSVRAQASTEPRVVAQAPGGKRATMPRAPALGSRPRGRRRCRRRCCRRLRVPLLNTVGGQHTRCLLSNERHSCCCLSLLRQNSSSQHTSILQQPPPVASCLGRTSCTAAATATATSRGSPCSHGAEA